MKVRDRDIRSVLRRELATRHEGETDVLILDELGLCQGTARVDMAVVNGSFNGYEIKSAEDTLARLPAQCEVYSRILDSVTIVTSTRHISAVLERIPTWFGVWDVRSDGANLTLEVVRKPRQNPGQDPYSVAQLLWREEVLRILEDIGLSKGSKRKPRHALWRILVESVDLQTLKELARKALKARPNWRSDPRRALGGATSRSGARS